MSPTGNSRAACEGGYSLLEVMLVLAIMATVASIVPMMVREASPEFRLRAEMDMLIRSLVLARSEARLEGYPVIVGVDDDRGGYGYGGGQVRLPSGVEITVEGPEELSGATAADRVVFYPRGGSSGGRLTLAFKGRMRAVSIDWLTSAIRRAEMP